MVAAAMIVTALAAVGTTSYNMVQQADAQKKQEQLQALEQAKKTRQQIAQARMASAEIQNQGANSGTTLSSGVEGGMGSVAAQMASNLGYLTQSSAIQSDIRQDQSNMALASGIGGLVQGVAGAAGAYASASSTSGSLFKQASAYEKNKSIFSNN